MSPIWQDSGEAQYDAAEGESLSDAYGEESRSARDRRLRMERVRREQALARARAGRPRPLPAPAPQRLPVAPAPVVRRPDSVDVEARARTEGLRSRQSRHAARMTRAEWSSVLSVLVAQGFDSFGQPPNAFLRAGLRAAPLALLAPDPGDKRGVERVVTDPRVIAGAAVAGLVFFGDRHGGQKEVAEVELTGPASIATDEKVLVLADARAKDGSHVDLTDVEWTAEPESVLTVEKPDGDRATVTAIGAGHGVVTARDRTSGRRGNISISVVSAFGAATTSGGPAPAGNAQAEAGGASPDAAKARKRASKGVNRQGQ